MIDAFNDGWMSFEGGYERRVGKIELIEALSKKVNVPAASSK